MISKKLAAGGRHYCRIHLGYDLFEHVLKGIGYLNEPSDTFRQESEDIKTGKALVLCPKGIIISQNVMGNPTVSWGVYVFYPRINWQKEPRLKNFIEMTVEEILKKEQELCVK